MISDQGNYFKTIIKNKTATLAVTLLVLICAAAGTLFSSCTSRQTQDSSGDTAKMQEADAGVWP